MYTIKVITINSSGLISINKQLLINLQYFLCFVLYFHIHVFTTIETMNFLKIKL